MMKKTGFLLGCLLLLALFCAGEEELRPFRKKALLIMPQEKMHDWYKPGFAARGWTSECVAAEKANLADPGGCDVVLIYSYNGHRIPQNFHTEKLLPAIRGGTIAVYTVAGTRFEPDRWFHDPSLKTGYTKNDPARRKFFFENPDFEKTPNPLSKSYRYNHSFTFVPETPGKWIPLICNLAADGTKKPVLMAAPCGKGMIVCAAAIQTGQAPHEVVLQLENLVAFNRARHAPAEKPEK